jgi:hypothetical protein
MPGRSFAERAAVSSPRPASALPFFLFFLSSFRFSLLTLTLFPSLSDSSIILAGWPINIIPRSTAGLDRQASNNRSGGTGNDNDSTRLLLTWLIALTTLSLAWLIYTTSMADSGGGK